MGLFDDNDSSALRSKAPQGELVIRELPKLVVAPSSDGVPGLKISHQQSQYRYTKEETSQHPLADRSDAILPPKYKGDHTFDPTTRVFEPSAVKPDPLADRLAADHQQNINPNFKTPESFKENSNPLQMPERSLFGGGNSGGDSSLKGPDLSVQKSFATLFEPSRSKGNSEGSLFVIIIASLAVLLGAILKFIGQIFWPWANRLNLRRRRFRFSRR